MSVVKPPFLERQLAPLLALFFVGSVPDGVHPSAENDNASHEIKKSIVHYLARHSL
jgi:hypothetical protein